MPQHILITGATGRLGSALVRALGQDAIVHQLSLDPPGPNAPPASGPIIQGSVTDEASVAQAMERVDVVIHCASYPGAIEPYQELMNTNVMGTFTVLEAAGRSESVKRVLHISSLHWYGLYESQGTRRPPHYLPLDERHPSLAMGYYDTSKVLAERLVESFAGRFGKSAVALRPAWIITPELEPSFKALPPVNAPHLNDYVGMSDVVNAIQRCLTYEPAAGYEVFALHADDQRSTMPTKELVEKHFPQGTCDTDKLEQYGLFTSLVDCTKARECLGWKPKYRCAR